MFHSCFTEPERVAHGQRQVARVRVDATVDALGPEFDIRRVDGTDRPALLAALADFAQFREEVEKFLAGRFKK